MNQQGYFYSEHSGGEIDLVLVDGIRVTNTIEIKLGGLNNLSKPSVLLHKKFAAENSILISGSSGKNIQLENNMRLMTVNNYFNEQATDSLIISKSQ
jgi:hypothetical protein